MIPIGGEDSNLITDPVQNDHSQPAAKSEPSDKVEVPLRPEVEDPKHDVALGTPKAKGPRSSKLLFLLRKDGLSLTYQSDKLEKKWGIFRKRVSFTPERAKSMELSIDGSDSISKHFSSSVVDESEQTTRKPHDANGVSSSDPVPSQRYLRAWLKASSKSNAIRDGKFPYKYVKISVRY